MIVCGGGAHNQELVRALAARLPRVAVRSSAQLGLEPDAVEAVAFAWLAARRLQGLPGNLPSVTGARRTGVLGAMYLP
jgi:anhydro-N-acetylmuramic acid kinase